MPGISPTTLFVTGSMSITLSPAELVWTMRTVAARSVTVVRIPAMASDASKLAGSLVFITEHFSRTGARSKLPPHIGHREDRHMARAAWLLLFIAWKALADWVKSTK